MAIEVCLGIEREPQPVPHRNPGGDCFACAATAGFRFLYPEREITLDEVWDLFIEEYYDGNAQANLQKLRAAVAPIIETPKDPATILDALQELERVYQELNAEKPATTVGNTWGGFEKVLNKASREWGRLEIAWDMVRPSFDESRGRSSYPWRYQDCGLDYTRRLEGWLRSGWVAFTEIRLDGGGLFDPTYTNPKSRHSVGIRGIDHFVVLDGARHRYVELEGGGGTWVDEIHVVDSSTRDITGWYETAPFTRSHAASSWWLARRDIR